MINALLLSEKVLFHINALVDMDMEKLDWILFTLMKSINKTRRNLVLSIQKLIKPDVLLMVSEVVDGTGNGCGCMQLDSVNHNSMLIITPLEKKDGLGSTLDLWTTDQKTSFSSMEKSTLLKDLTLKLINPFQLERISPLRKISFIFSATKP